jgi:hypothetical protein
MSSKKIKVKDRNALVVTPSGLEKPATPTKFRVVLCRAGLDPKAYEVPIGTTVGDLLEEVGAKVVNHILTIGRRRVTVNEELTPESVLFVVPQPKNV